MHVLLSEDDVCHRQTSSPELLSSLLSEFYCWCFLQWVGICFLESTQDCTKGIIIIIVIVIFLLSSDRWQVLFMLWCTIGEAIQKMYLFSDKIRKERGESRPIQNFCIRKNSKRGRGGVRFPDFLSGSGNLTRVSCRNQNCAATIALTVQTVPQHLHWEKWKTVCECRGM